MALAQQGYDIVLARRKVRQDVLLKRVFSRLFYKIFNLLSGYRMDPSVGAFRIEATITTVMLTAEPSGGTPKPTLPVLAQGNVPAATSD